MKVYLKTGLSMISLALVVACAKPPTQEIASAENAINTAIQAGAEDYAAAELKAAQDVFADANARVENKDYKGAKLSALDALSKAEAAQAAVESNRNLLKTDVEGKLAALKTDVEGTVAAALKMKGKGLEQIKADADALKDIPATIQAELDAANIKSASAKTAEAGAALDALKAAIAAYKPAPKK